MIEARELMKTYPDGTTALEGIDLRVDTGELLFIRGQSGAGKTTLFRLITGMESPSGGTLVVDGHDMDRAPAGVVRQLRRQLGIVFQDFRLIRGRTAQENVELGMRVLGIRGAAMRKSASELLERVGLEHRRMTLVDALSWGERQRLEVARALARDPSIIIADEPTGNLDQELSELVLELFYSAHRRGATVLIATHAQALLSATDHRVVTLARGRLIRDTGTARREGGVDHVPG